MNSIESGLLMTAHRMMLENQMTQCKRGLDTEFNFKGKAEMAIWRTKKQVYLV